MSVYREHNNGLIVSICFSPIHYITKSTIGLYPNVCRIQLPEKRYQQILHGSITTPNEAKEHKFKLVTKERVFLHPKSINFFVNEWESPWLVFHQKMKTSKVSSSSLFR